MKVLKIWTWRFEPLCLSLNQLPRSRYFTSTHSCATIRKEVGEAAAKGARRIPQFPLRASMPENLAKILHCPHDCDLSAQSSWGLHMTSWGTGVTMPDWYNPRVGIGNTFGFHLQDLDWWQGETSEKQGFLGQVRVRKLEMLFLPLVFFGHLYIGWQETSVRITSLLWPSAVTIVHHGCQVFLQEVVNFQELVERTRAFLLSTTLHLVSAGVCWCLSPPPRPWT